jgi:hypothetical protein
VSGLKVLGQLCVPKAGVRHPIALYSHAGTDGLDGGWGQGTRTKPSLCAARAQNGDDDDGPLLRARFSSRQCRGGAGSAGGAYEAAEELVEPPSSPCLNCSEDAAAVLLGDEATPEKLLTLLSQAQTAGVCLFLL